ncbi:hypothetical protein SAMN05216490_3597 [Mucilaginibacter mallensis]|uniref:Membrane protein involved in the export of O-antigen and teichoic acid n=1 Tax=Mucilaginibacter mallensis TaxID=652787 RepID=A0A1H2ALS1_MUCMA|nr:hypothetical protein [Mucilaginibacter mallensis]SDT46870.1 hypothetical protein SAMN05216490_3597 [Mucilaginibacter mallensis]
MSVASSPSRSLNISKISKSIKASVTKDVMFTLVNSLWRIISGPVTLVFIPLFLTSQVQGFWYTFISLAALTVFADLGFTTIVTQFAAHEYARLTFNAETGLFEGETNDIKRIGSLLRFVFKWSVSVGAVGFPVILSVGFLMFRGKGGNVNWPLPWCVYVLSSGLSFTTQSVLSFFEGCSQIAAIEKNKFVSAIASTIATLTFLYFGFNLYSLAFAAFIAAAINIGMLYFRFGKLIAQMVTESKGYIVNWKTDFLNLIWRYAISWSSGYFIFQIYTPLMFQFHGPAEAGKVGISMALASAAFSISYVWMYVANPKLNMYASTRNWKAMDKLFIKNLSLSLITFSLGAILVLSILYFYGDAFKFFHRFLGFVPMLILLLAWFFQIIINGLAVYLRAHKKEPLVVVSVALAIYIGITTLLITKYLPPKYLFLGFLTAVLWGLPVVAWIFVKKRKEWHV